MELLSVKFNFFFHITFRVVYSHPTHRQHILLLALGFQSENLCSYAISSHNDYMCSFRFCPITSQLMSSWPIRTEQWISQSVTSCCLTTQKCRLLTRRSPACLRPLRQSLGLILTQSVLIYAHNITTVVTI